MLPRVPGLLLALLLAVGATSYSQAAAAAAPSHRRGLRQLQVCSDGTPPPCDGSTFAAAGGTAAAPAPYVRPAMLAAACKASAVSDLDGRVNALGYDISARVTSSWGPRVTTFPEVSPANAAPAGCNPVSWAQWRVFGTIQRLVAEGFCYCHHHAVWWLPPDSVKDTCVPDCVGTRTLPKQGADCSTYTAYVYNLAFGLRFTAAIGAQACKIGDAPGRLLPFSTAQQDMFQPGDILFITEGGPSAPVRVSHAVLWTGLQVDFKTSGGQFSADTMLVNTKPAQRAAVKAYMDARSAAGLPVYVISDSHYTGINYRPFAGWYISSFSHARRVLYDPNDSSLPTTTYDPSVAVWSPGGARKGNNAGDCMSNWALNGRGAPSLAAFAG